MDLTTHVRVSAPGSDALWQAYIACRVRNLYDPYRLPASCALSELDSPRDRPDVLHRLVLDGESVIAVARMDLDPQEVPPSCARPVAQLRYFAVDTNRRGTGVGRVLMHAIEREAVQRGRPAIWMDARAEAVPFYARLGYEDIGVGPTKWDMIPHRKMARSLA